MTLQASGAITLTNIQTEFGGSNPISLSEYYAGGANVPSGTIGYPSGVSTAIPTSGTISFANFYGSTAILPIPDPYQFLRFTAAVDRITVYRFNVYTGANSLVSTTSSQGLGSNIRIMGLTDSTNLSKITPNGPSASIVADPVYRNSWGVNDPYGQTYFSITHQPTAAEPYVDVMIDDDGPPTSALVTLLINMQLGNGATAPVVSTAPYFFDAYIEIDSTSGSNTFVVVNYKFYNLLPSSTYTLTITTNGSHQVDVISQATNSRGDFVGFGSYDTISQGWGSAETFTLSLTGHSTTVTDNGGLGPYDLTVQSGGGGGGGGD